MSAQEEDAVKAVARAIHQADEQNGAAPWDLDANNKHVREMRLDRARAAISAYKAATTRGILIEHNDKLMTVAQAEKEGDKP